MSVRMLIEFFFSASSIYKSVLKSKGSINEVNQIAQVSRGLILNDLLESLELLIMKPCLIEPPASYNHKTKAQRWSWAFVRATAGWILFSQTN